MANHPTDHLNSAFFAWAPEPDQDHLQSSAHPWSHGLSTAPVPGNGLPQSPTYDFDQDTPKPPQDMIDEFNRDLPDCGGEFSWDDEFAEGSPAILSANFDPTADMSRTNSSFSRTESNRDETDSQAFSIDSAGDHFSFPLDANLLAISPTGSSYSEVWMRDWSQEPGFPRTRGFSASPMMSHGFPQSTRPTQGRARATTLGTQRLALSTTFSDIVQAGNSLPNSQALGSVVQGASSAPNHDIWSAPAHGGAWDSSLQHQVQSSRGNPQSAGAPEIKVDPFEDGNFSALLDATAGSVPPASRLLSPLQQSLPNSRYLPIPSANRNNGNRVNKRRVSDPPRPNYRGAARASTPATRPQPRADGHSGSPTSTLSEGLNTSYQPSDVSRRPGTAASDSLLTTSTPRGKRKGPMPIKARQEAKRTRNEKTVCIRCKHARQSCKRPEDDPEGDCLQCSQPGRTSKWPGPCVRAYFDDNVIAGPLNFVAPRVMYHKNSQQDGRACIPMPEEFDWDAEMTQLDQIRGRYNFRVYQNGEPIYTLDLDKCYKYLSKIRQQLSNKDFDPRIYVDKEIMRIDAKLDDWESCMIDCTIQHEDPRESRMALLCALTNMPSFASYYYVAKSSNSPWSDASRELPVKLINVAMPAERRNLLLAAQLASIIRRKLEVDVFTYLQKTLHAHQQMEEAKLLPLVQGMGKMLVLLRWRLSCLAELGDSCTGPGNAARRFTPGMAGVLSPSAYSLQAQRSTELEQFETRVHSLTKTLYFHYLAMKRKLPMGTSTNTLKGIVSKYIETRNAVWDDFPEHETLEGFDVWMAKGKELIRQAGLGKRL